MLKIALRAHQRFLNAFRVKLPDMASASPKRSKIMAAPSKPRVRARLPAPRSAQTAASDLNGPLFWRCLFVFILRRQLDAWVLGPWLFRGKLKQNLAQAIVLKGPAGDRPEIIVSPGRFDLLKFARFLGVGGLAAATNFSSRFAWSLILPFEAAVICAYATGMVLAFTLFRLFVFPGSPLPLPVQVRNFLVVNAIGAGLTFTTAFVLVRGLFPLIGFSWHAEAIGHGMAIAVPVASSWIGHRRFTFARS